MSPNVPRNKKETLMSEANEAYADDLRREFDRATPPSLPVITPPPGPMRLVYDGPKGPLFKALAEARKHFTSLSASATADVAMKNGGKYQFSYAPLDVVLDALQPGLTAAGLALLQPFDGDVMYTIVAFEGSSLTVETPLPSWTTPQELGSLLTYLRRYQIKGIFGVADSEDDDGNTASGNKSQVTRKEPTVAPKPAGKLSPELSAQVIAKAKEIGMSGQELSEAAKKHAGKPWKDCDDSDAAKLLAVLDAKEVFGKDGAK
jgi:hypothetical protein